MASIHNEQYCAHCHQFLELAGSLKPEKDEDGKYRIGRIQFADHIPISQALTVLKLKFPGIRFHRLTRNCEWAGYTIMASHAFFPPSEGDAFEVPLLNPKFHNDEWGWIKAFNPSEDFTGKQLRRLYKNYTGHEVEEAGDVLAGEPGMTTFGGFRKALLKNHLDEHKRHVDAAEKRRIEEECELKKREFEANYVSSRGGPYKAHCKKLHEEMGGDDALVNREVLIKKSADRCEICDGPADHVPGGIHCPL